MSDGWIKVHRKIKDHWLYQDKPFDRYHAWEDLLLSVNHEQNTFLHGNKLLTVERGQVVTSLRKLGERWGWNQEKVKRFLTLLQSEAMIQIRCDTTMTLVTVANWAFYQSSDVKVLHDCDTTVTPIVTNKNEKNDKNDKKQRKSITVVAGAPKKQHFKAPTIQEVTAYCQERGNDVNPQRFVDYFAASNWIDSEGKPVKNWKQKIITWEGARNGRDKNKNDGLSKPSTERGVRCQDEYAWGNIADRV